MSITFCLEAIMARLHMLRSVTDTINTSFVFECEEGLFVIDGGFPSESEYMYEYLRTLGGKVRVWFFTHPHDDHVGCFLELMRAHGDISVEEVYHCFPSKEFSVSFEPRQSRMTAEELYDRFKCVIEERGINEKAVAEGEVYSFGELNLRVLRTADEAITVNPINNSSTVYRFEINGKSLLFLGDLGVEGGKQLLERADPSLLRSDYVQMAHHGQQGVSKEVYEAISPRYTFWCTPTWLWDNVDRKNGGGYDSGNYKTIVVRGWMSELGCVRRHYRMIDGNNVIEL